MRSVGDELLLSSRLCGGGTDRGKSTTVKDKVLPKYKLWSEATLHAEGNYIFKRLLFLI